MPVFPRPVFPDPVFPDPVFPGVGGGGGGVPVMPGTANPIVINEAMSDSYHDSGVAANTLAFYPKAIFWDNPGAAGHKVIILSSATGHILFTATARAQYDSQYFRPTRVKSGNPRGGVKWLDFIVTQLDSGQLYIWY